MNSVPKKFDVKTLKFDRVYLTIGCRESGKTTLMQHLYTELTNQYQQFYKSDNEVENEHKDIIAVSNRNALRSWSRLPRTKETQAEIGLGWHDPKVNTLIQSQSSIVDKHLETIPGDDGRSFVPLRVVVADDVFNVDKKLIQGRTVHELLMNGRILKTALFVGTQTTREMPGWFRTNVDYVFLHGNNNLFFQKKAYEEFFGMFNSFDEFQAAFEEIRKTHPRAVMVVDNTNGHRTLEETVFWYDPYDDVEPAWDIVALTCHSCGQVVSEKRSADEMEK